MINVTNQKQEPRASEISPWTVLYVIPNFEPFRYVSIFHIRENCNQKMFKRHRYAEISANVDEKCPKLPTATKVVRRHTMTVPVTIL